MAGIVEAALIWGLRRVGVCWLSVPSGIHEDVVFQSLLFFGRLVTILHVGLSFFLFGWCQLLDSYIVHPVFRSPAHLYKYCIPNSDACNIHAGKKETCIGVVWRGFLLARASESDLVSVEVALGRIPKRQGTARWFM